MKITKQFVAKVMNADVHVDVVNYKYKRAEIKVVHNRKEYQFCVTRTHPALAIGQYPHEPEEFMMCWQSHTGRHEPIPEELVELKQKLIQAATIDSQEADNVLQERGESVRRFRKEFYGE